MKKYVDFLVIGSGLAGLGFALKVAPYGKVAIITKDTVSKTNTSYAQGGIAAVVDSEDSYEKHINDTLDTGDGLSRQDVVRMVISEAPSQIDELVSWGTEFDKSAEGTYDLNKEGGHTAPRVLHHKDHTGHEIQSSLMKRAFEHPNIEILEERYALDLITQHHLGEIVTHFREDIMCYGAYVLDRNSGSVDTFLSKLTFLGTGGVGNIYQTTTNPHIATGDGIAMVYRAKGIIDNMEFIQFHPTAFYEKDVRPSFLISEALRGYGAILRNWDGDTFMEKYDSRGSLAPRDIVARAIDHEMKTAGADCVYLDATRCDANGLIEHFPNIYKKGQVSNIDITRDLIPVSPAAHFVCGGIRVNKTGESSINNLFAGGENASTGLHGANRLASNSLLEAIVFADKSAKAAIDRMEQITHCEGIPDWNFEGTSFPEEMILITQEFKELQSIMSNYVGIVRSDLRLQRAFDRLELLYKETEALYKRATPSSTLCELRNAINAAYLVIKMARRRKESRGLHYNLDYPSKRHVNNT